VIPVFSRPVVSFLTNFQSQAKNKQALWLVPYAKGYALGGDRFRGGEQMRFLYERCLELIPRTSGCAFLAAFLTLLLAFPLSTRAAVGGEYLRDC
jgi:hypothetical protein